MKKDAFAGARVEETARPSSFEPQGIIEVRDLSFKYLDEAILSNVDFSIEKSTFTGIIGPNGSGKTTLLKCLVKILPPEAGRIALGGEDITGLSVKSIARKVGVVPQKWETAFAFRVADLVLMGRFPHLAKLKQESALDLSIVRDAMEVTKILHLAERPINELSGGELQRVIIAQVLAQSPEIILLDEPTSSLDINYQLEICDLLKELISNQKLTVVAVMHDLNLAARYCEKLILLKEGKIFAMGPVSEVLTAANLESVYGVKASLRKDIFTGKAYINILDKVDARMRDPKKPGVKLKLHIIGGGGTASEFFGTFLSFGCELSTGVLNVMDTDWQTAKELGLSLVEEAPFSPVTEETHRENLEVLSEKDIVILNDIPFGTGNLKNLTAAEVALKAGKKLIICDFTPIKERDFTGGVASAIYSKLVDEARLKGSRICGSKGEVVDFIRNLMQE